MFAFLGLGYLTWDDFFLILSICLQIMCLNWLFGVHSFWRDTLLGLDIVVLPQSDLPDFIDSSWEASASLRSGWGMGRGMSGRWGTRRKEQSRN